MILATFVNSHFSVKTQITCSKLFLHFGFENHSNKSMGWRVYWWHSFLQHYLHNTVKVYTHFYTYYLPTSQGTFAHLGNTPYIRRCLQVQNVHHCNVAMRRNECRHCLCWRSFARQSKIFCSDMKSGVRWVTIESVGYRLLTRWTHNALNC